MSNLTISIFSNKIFSEIINETNTKVVESWKSVQHNKARDTESAKVINVVEQTPEEVLAS